MTQTEDEPVAEQTPDSQSPCQCQSYLRATEHAALRAARWLGRADQEAAEEAAADGMRMTLDQFAKSFQARPGTYQVTIINPVSRTPANVSFTLPEGSPRRVIVRRDQIVFNYGRLHFVRIDFDEDGAIVTSR